MPSGKFEQLPTSPKEKEPEKWAEEIPAEIFGTEEERRENCERSLQDFKEKRAEEHISEEEFEKRLAGARQYLENMPLTHATSLKSVVDIFKSEKILSVHELEKEKPVSRHTHTLTNDQECGLDKWIFLSNGTRAMGYGDAIIVLDNKILERPDCLVSTEDIMDIPKRLQDVKNLEGWGAIDKTLSPVLWTEIVKEYRQQTVAGKDFKNLLAEFIATSHQDSQDYTRHYFGPGYHMEDFKKKRENSFSK